METLVQDIRFAFRSLARARAFSAVVIVVMALGIGVNVTVFTMVYGFVWRQWPLPEAGRIVSVVMTNPRRGFDDMSLSWPNYLDLRDRAKSFESLGGHWGNTALVTLDRDPERLAAGVVTAEVFPSLGVRPQIGRNITRDESTWGHNWSTVLISDRIWRDRYHSDRGVLGRTLRLNGRVRTIVGVMPPNFRFPETEDFWFPAGYNPAEDKRTDTQLRLIGRLRPGVTLEQARAEVKSLFATLRHEHPELKEFDANVMTVQQQAAHGPRPFVMFLLYAVSFVLLIACANVANLMLARAAGRRREIALRLSLGASRGRIVRQLLTESVLIALAGGSLGLWIGHWGNQLWPLGIAMELPFYLRFPIDGPILLYALSISMGSGILFGLAPAIHASGENFTEALREGSAQSGTSPRGRRLRSAFVVAEVAMSLVLLVGAGLMVRSFQRISESGEELHPDGAVTAQVLLPIASYPDENAMRRFLREFTARLLATPGVHAVGGMTSLPLGRNNNGQLVLTPTTGDPRNGISTDTGTMLPGSLHLLGLDVRKGREFTAHDDEHAPRVAIVNEALAARLFPKGDAVGQRIRFAGEPDSIGWRTIVGIMPDIIMNVESSHPQPFSAWSCELQETQQFLAMVVRADGDGSQGAAAMRSAMRTLDPTLPLIDLRTLREELRFALWVKRLLASMISVVALLALIIAAVGLYGVVAYNVVQRTREIGIRMALGADAAAVQRMIVGHALRLTFIGLAIGLVGAFLLTRFMASVMVGVSPNDPPTYAVVASLLALSGLVAAWGPALRATRVDPMVALRYE